VDLLGEPTVQLLNATVTTAMVLSAMAALLLLSVRVAQSSAPGPALVARPAGTGRPLCPDRDDVRSFEGLRTSLPTRAPPGLHPLSDSRLMVPTTRWGVRANESRSRSRATPRFGMGR